MQIDWPLGRMFSFLTKQYIGEMALRMKNTPIERYYFPLYLIGKNSGKISQQELADQLLMDKVSLVRILDVLTNDGYVIRTVNPNDRRQHLLSLTDKAKPWISEIEQGLIDTNNHFIGFLPEENRQLFSEMLQLLICKTKDLPIEDIELFYNRPKDEITEK
jgi:MarR family transcriptional regulator for hemolysin